MSDDATPTNDQPTPEPEAAPPAAEQAPPAEQAAEPGKPIIKFDDFAKLDLRVATIVEVAEHPNADRLWVLKVDLGGEQRTLCAGIKAFYSPEALLGKQIVVVANLQPRKVRGIESKGMLLAASAGEKEDVVVLALDRPVPPGSSVS
ncbi:MAG: methionine--tRNA ligase subunit beta [Planctomycetota bacterium]|jgi:methionyl-tRNA synthetase